MDRPEPAHPPAPKQPVPPGHSGARAAMAALLRGTGWIAHWLPGAALALLVGAGVAGWVWAGQDGSLPRMLGWAQAWLHDPNSTAGRLQAEGAQGSLRGGGTVQTLRWSGPGLDIQAHGLTLRWHSAQLIDALLLRRLQTDTLHITHLQVDDQRPTTDEALQALELPLPVELAWAVDRLQWSGRQHLRLHDLRGHYRYRSVQASDQQAWGADGAAQTATVSHTHHLRLDAITLAQGHYQAEALLGAQAPLPLHLAAVGRIQAVLPEGRPLNLQAAASAHGHLAGSHAVLDMQAHVLPAGAQGSPTLSASARLMPHAPQPLQQVQAQAHALDLALLWPQAPATALSGQVHAETVGQSWRARLDLQNTRSGPWDRQRLPLDHLQARMEQDGPLWRVTDLRATLGAGQMQGSGRYRAAAEGQPAHWQGELTARAIDPARLWSTLAPARWDLQASARQHAGPTDAVALDVRLQGAGDSGGGLRLRELRLLGHWLPTNAGGELHLNAARLEAAQATLDAHGMLSVAARRFAGDLQLQLPGAQGHLQGDLAATNGQGELELTLDSAERLLAWLHGLRQLPLVGQPLAQALDGTPWLRAGSLRGQGRLQARWQGGLAPLGLSATQPAGAQGTAALHVHGRLDLPQLSAQASDTAAGWRLRDVQLQADGRPQDLAWQLRAQAMQGPWAMALQTQGRAQGGWPWPDARAPQAHLQLQALHLRATDARQPGQPVEWTLRTTQPLSVSAHGHGPALALQATAGQLQVLQQVQHQVQQHQAQPALRLPQDPLATARTATTASPPGTGPEPSPLLLAWDSLAWQNGALHTQGRLTGLPLAWLDTLGSSASDDHSTSDHRGPLTRAGLSGDLLLDGAWDLSLPWHTAGMPRLQAHLQARRGDLLLRTDALDAPPAASRHSPAAQRSDPPASTRLLGAGVREARLELSIQDAKLQARLRWDSERLGQLSADLSSTLSSNAGGQGTLIDRWWPASTPWQGSLSARLPQVGAWSALAPPGWRMRGSLQLDASLGGSRSQPDWRGTLRADQLALRSVVDGFEFSQGQLRASLSGERISIHRFDLQGPLGGSLSASGQAQWPLVQGRRQPHISLQLQAQQLRLSNRADRRLTLSGQANAQLAGPALTIRGQLKADAALFVLPDETTPSLSADVVVRGGRNLPPDTDSTATVRPDVLVQLDLGPQFEVRGRGLQARLSGQLELRSTPAQPTPRVFGVVRTASGSYRAYGQQLQLDTGELTFNGPFDDPALKVLAIRPLARSTEQQVGVHISGTAQAPRVRLVATPELPDAEKLAWLVLGRPATGAGAEAAILQQAALALLAGNDDTLNSGLAGALGLDELSVRGQSVNADGSTRAAAVTLGKRLSQRLYLSYETGLANAVGTVSVFYDLSRRLTLRAQAGEVNAIDLIFTLQHD